MIFERIFESRANRAMMIGLFLAMLELIREKLIWAEQSADSKIYLRPLTDEPAEQAVQKAIVADEADLEESARAQRQEQPPIPIAELPAEGKSPETTDSEQPAEQPAIPIAELPPEGRLTVLAQEREDSPAESPDGPEHQPAD